MAQKTTSYRPTPVDPATAVEVRSSAIEDLDDFMGEIDDLLTQEEAFALRYRARNGQ